MSHTATYITPITGASVTNANITFDAQGLITAATSGSGGTITTQDEGVPLSTTVTTLNFVGDGVVASGGGATTTVTVASFSATNVTLAKNNAVAYGATQTIEWNVVVSDPLGMYNNGTGGAGGTAAVTIPTTGTYLVSWGIYGSAANPNAYISVNGGSATLNSTTNGTGISVGASGIFSFSAGDSVKTISGGITTIAASSFNFYSITKLH